jgi:hypothetical protein
MPVDAGFGPRASRLAAQAGDMDVEADTSTTRYSTHHPDLFRHRRFETPVGGRACGGKIGSKTAT